MGITINEQSETLKAIWWFHSNKAVGVFDWVRDKEEEEFYDDHVLCLMPAGDKRYISRDKLRDYNSLGLSVREV